MQKELPSVRKRMDTRIFVKKKEAYRVEADSLFHELKTNLNLEGLKGITLYNTYDVFHADAHDIELLKKKVLSEVVTDEIYDAIDLSDQTYIAYECLPGQYDQRADSAQQCLMLLNNKSDVVIKSGHIVVMDGTISEQQLAAVRQYLINPVEMREKDLRILTNEEDVTIEPVPVIEGFIGFDTDALQALREKEGLAMTLADLIHVQTYFRDEEKRDLTMTELKVLDTYWSDHCRHTTFETILQNVKIEAGALQETIQKAYDTYVRLREEVHGGRKVMTLMDIATIGGKTLRKRGKLEDLEVSDEINACSIEVKVDVDGEEQDWLLMFKNETHNHPTEIEPFGGASTCIGGAIRDPLSGRSYVYQAMRITGAGDITKDLSETLEHKLPQSRISKGAAQGYSSYGNQIGLATTYVKEIFDEGYVAKRMEVGAVVGAAPKANVKREKPAPGDIVVLIGGATGRDGVGGATGSSKEHNDTSLTKCSSEVQKGNAPIERKLQRLFRNPKATRLIKKANDFGAGGVSVAVGELADGLRIDLDQVPVKYAGLSGTELAISESQERMAVLIEAKDFEAFKQYAYEENLDACIVAEVSEEPRLVMTFQGKEIVNMSRAFLDTNGVRGVQDVVISEGEVENDPFVPVRTTLLDNLRKENVASQIGLAEMFDASIGKSSVLMPFGGKYQLTESEGSVQKLPVFGFTNTCSILTHGFHPQIARFSPYLGASYSVVEALARVTALGGDYRTCRLSNQEYFERLHDDPKKWGKPMQALLGLVDAQLAFETPSIGGKDSMSGTFNEIDVPPTLVSFAVDVAKEKDIITPELKKPGSKLIRFSIEKDEYEIPVYEQVMKLYDAVSGLIRGGVILSAYALDSYGAAAALAKMAFGNQLGVAIADDVNPKELFTNGLGDIVAEVDADQLGKIDVDYEILGVVTAEPMLRAGDAVISMEEALKAWKGTLEKVFPTKAVKGESPVKTPIWKNGSIVVCKHKVAKPTVFIPVFPGTNCEYDSRKAFERAGANVVTRVFRNLSAEDIRDSVEIYAKEIGQAQIIMFPGGFSAGDEPDGSAKFFATAFRNEKIKEAVQKLLAERDGLCLGICNGFQALIKLGLVPYGEIVGQKEDSPTLTFNTINRHISRMVYTKVVSNKSPWLAEAEVGRTYVNPASHGEGRFVAPKEWIDRLFENGQVATQYADFEGNVTMDEEWNINGSYASIEGITSPDGRILGKMAHSERRDRGVAINIYGEQDLKIFESGVKYFL